MNSVQRFLVVLFVMGGVCSGGVADAATYYVSTNGSDGRSCSEAQSPSSPMRTLNNATACLSAGDTLYLRGGVYDESLYVNEYNPRRGGMASGTSWGNKVRIAAYPGDGAVWLRPLSNFTSAAKSWKEYDRRSPSPLTIKVTPRAFSRQFRMRCSPPR